MRGVEIEFENLVAGHARKQDRGWNSHHRQVAAERVRPERRFLDEVAPPVREVRHVHEDELGLMLLRTSSAIFADKGPLHRAIGDRKNRKLARVASE